MKSSNDSNYSHAYGHTSASNASSSCISPPAPEISALRRYVHLYMPLVTTVIILANHPLFARIQSMAGDTGGRGEMLLVAGSAIPTYLVGSLFYPANRPPPTAEESQRFTRKSEWYRALVLFTYGRLYGTPFDLGRYISDLLLNHTADHIIGERSVDEPQRTSEFAIALLWLCGSYVLWSFVAPSMDMLWLILGIADRTIWRSTYIALVDDCIGVMTRPNVSILKGRLTLVLVQSFTITSLTWLALSTLAKYAPRS